MEDFQPALSDSAFIWGKVPLLLGRFALSYQQEFSCVDYFINDRTTGCRISKNILFTLDRLERRIVISSFYPELFKQTDAKYLSAACFYLMVHHFNRISAIPTGYEVFLTAKPAVFAAFYGKLKDFSFCIQGPETSDFVEVISTLEFSNVDTTMIAQIDG
jgi:hypothetical protein